MPGGLPALIHARHGHATVLIDELLMDRILAPALDDLSETLLAPYHWVDQAAERPAFDVRMHLVRDVGAGRLQDFIIAGNTRRVLADRSLMFDPLPEVLTRQAAEVLRNFA